MSGLKIIVATDLKETGTCSFSILKENLWSSPVFTALRKNSPYTEPLSMG